MSSDWESRKFLSGLASQFAESEAMRLSRLAFGTDSFGRPLADSVTEQILLRKKLVDPLTQAGITSEAARKAIENTRLFDRKTGADRFMTAGTVSEEVRKQLFATFGDTISDVLGRLQDHPGLANLASTQQKILERDMALTGAFMRATRWSEAFNGPTAADYAAIVGSDRGILSQMDAIREVSGRLASAHYKLEQNAYLGPIDDLFGNTAAKLSIFAGTIDVLGPASSSSQAALDALLGSYSAAAAPTNRGYWSRADERARHYRDHDVDEGLVAAETAATVTALVETGVVEGRRTRGGSITAVVEIGGVRMNIVARRPKAGARDAIDAFENRLRLFIEAHLSAVAGEKWFPQRVPGKIVERAKEKRREAVRAGESPLTLIHYLDLGELIPVLQRGDNWGVFEPIFDRKDWLTTDMERLNALRRPAMHSRPIDAVQLVEIVTTIRRLVGWMERDPDWLSGWDNDV